MKMKSSPAKDGFCSACCKVRTFQSGPAIKSPPKEKLKKNNFRRRWLVLALMELCDTCRQNKHADQSCGDGGVGDSDDASNRYCSVLFYYADQSESSLKGKGRLFY